MSEQGCTRPEVGDLLAAYELNLLEAEDRLRFESHLETCAWCVEELYAHAPCSEDLLTAPGRHAATLRRASRASDSGFAVQFRAMLRRLLQPRVLAPVGTVAAVALALVLLMPGDLMTPGAAGLAIVEPLPYQTLDLRGGADSDLAGLLAGGLQRYADGDYAGAARDLAAAWAAAGTDETWSDRSQAALYLGLSLLLDQRPDEALAPLRVAGASRLLPVAERGRWYLAQAHLLREDPRASVPLLESLLQSPVYGDPASDQLHAVREICDTPAGE